MSSIPALASLLKQTSIEDHESVLQAADESLKQSKGDLDTQHVKVVALLQLDRYEDAVKAVEQGGAKLKEKARLEYAYALYKSGRPAEAAEIAKDGGERGLQHVEAQARYRTEDFARAAESYRQLAQSLEGDADADLRINGGAVDAQLEWSRRGELAQRKKVEREDLEAFETAYNAACGSIARGELKQGEMLLKRAHDLCSSLEDMSDEEKEAELLPIRVQQVYVMARLGKAEDADALAQKIDVSSIPDASTRHIAQVNLQAATPLQSNPYMTQRLVAKDIDSLKPDYPYQFQTSILQQNRYAANLQSLKFGGTADSTAATIAKQPAPTLDPACNGLSVVNAAAHTKNQTGKEAPKLILPVLEKRPNDVGLLLTIAQLYVVTGNAGSAITLIEKFLMRLEQSGTAGDLDVRFAPGLVGTIVSLHNSQGRRGHVEAELAKAATYWRTKLKEQTPNAGVIGLLRAAGAVLLESQNTEQRSLAGEIFQDLHNLDANDRYANAGLAAATSSSSNPQIDQQSISKLTSTIDTDALENAGIAKPHHAPTVITRKRPAESDTKPKKTKKIKASRMPKDYDPNRKPDSERWLPMRDRSYYRPKGKKGKARANLLSQGAAPAGDSDGSRPGTPGGQIVQGKQQGGGGGGKKKKGKGGKW